MIPDKVFQLNIDMGDDVYVPYAVSFDKSDDFTLEKNSVYCTVWCGEIIAGRGIAQNTDNIIEDYRLALDRALNIFEPYQKVLFEQQFNTEVENGLFRE
jgi:hypothetical protein